MSSGEPPQGLLVLMKAIVSSVSVPKKYTSSIPLFQWAEISHQYCVCSLENTVVAPLNKVCVGSGIFLHTDGKNWEMSLLRKTKCFQNIPLPKFFTGRGRLCQSTQGYFQP